MTLTLTPEIESAIAEQAQRERTTPEQLVSERLRKLFVTAKPAPDEILDLAAQVYAGLSEQEVKEIEEIALDRSNFASQRQAF